MGVGISMMVASQPRSIRSYALRMQSRVDCVGGFGFEGLRARASSAVCGSRGTGALFELGSSIQQLNLFDAFVDCPKEHGFLKTQARKVQRKPQPYDPTEAPHHLSPKPKPTKSRSTHLNHMALQATKKPPPPKQGRA